MKCTILFNAILIGISLSITAQNQDTTTSNLISKSDLISNVLEAPSNINLESTGPGTNQNTFKLFSTLSITFGVVGIISFGTAISYISRSENQSYSEETRYLYEKKGKTFGTIGSLLGVSSIICWQVAVHSPPFKSKKPAVLEKEKINSDKVYMSLALAGPGFRFQIKF
jgi:hypothetical protein